MTVDSLRDVSVLQQLRGHSSDVTCCDFAPNFTLVTGSSDKSVRVWAWTVGEGYAETAGSPLLGHKYGVTCVRVSPQGAMFATTSVDGTAILWGLRSLHRLNTLVQVNGDAVRTCRFAPDSTVLLTGGDNGAICIWDLVHRSLIRCVAKHEGTVQCLSFTSDSRLVVSGCSRGVLHVWNVSQLTDSVADEQTPAPAATVDDAHDLGMLGCDIARHTRPDDNNPLVKRYTCATSGNDDTIKLWEITSETAPKHVTTTGRDGDRVLLVLTAELLGHRSSVTSVRYSHCASLLASAGLDKAIKLWNSAGECVRTLNSHTRYVTCVAFTRDTALLASAGSNDKTAIVWDMTGGKVSAASELVKPSSQLSNTLSALQHRVQEAEVVRSAETDEDHVKLIELIDDIADGPINACQFYGTSTLATGSGDKLVKVFHISEDTVVEELTYSPYESHTYPVNYIDFNNDGSKLASCSLDGSTIIWDTQTGEQLRRIPNYDLGGNARLCRFSADGARLVTAGDDEMATVWEVDTLDQIMHLRGHSDSIIAACFTPDGDYLATGCSNGFVRIWSMGSGSCVHVLEDAHDLGVQGCDFSQNLEPLPAVDNHTTYLLATCGNDNTVKLWRTAVPKLNTAGRRKPEGARVVTPWATLRGHGGNVMSVRMSPKTGEIICSTATDRQARIWSTYSSECLHVLEHNSMTVCCSFSEDTSMLAVGCLDKTLWLWKLPQKLIFQTIVANKMMKSRKRAVIDWRLVDIVAWANDLGMTSIALKLQRATTLDGQKLLTLPTEAVCTMLQLAGDGDRFRQELDWLKRDELNPQTSGERRHQQEQMPEEFLCPITHELMRTPVVCGDGFTYERQAIVEWFLCGRYTSPMTNETLPNTDYAINQRLRNSIHAFLYGQQLLDLDDAENTQTFN